MRRLVYACLLCLPPTVCGQAPQSRPGLSAEVESVAHAHRGDVSLYAEDLATHQTVAIAPDAVVQTASVIKLTILYEALEQIRSGNAHFEDRIRLAPAERVPGSGVLHLLDAPLDLTFKDVLTLMVIMSDNVATNLAIDHLGLEKINARTMQLGMKNTYLYKKVFTPVAPGTLLPPDFKRFGLGKTTAREMAALMTRFVRCDLASTALAIQPGDQALCDAALNMLHLQFYRNAIPRYLDSMPGVTATSIANKTGSLDAVRNDVAAISTPHGIIVIACFTTNNLDHSWGVEQEGELTIAKIARAIVTTWSPTGLAPWPSSAPALSPNSTLH